MVVPDARVQRDDGVEVVDLQALGLDDITPADDRLRLGAMVRLGDLVADDRVPALIQDLARHELPSALRNQATIGGTIALAEGESVLLAGLLAYGADVECHDRSPASLADFLAEGVGDRLIIAVTIDTTGSAAWAATGRTPKDTPIVAAVARVGAADTRLAFTGVASTPVLADPADPTAGLDPPGDFRGSNAYRRQLASTLAARALDGATR